MPSERDRSVLHEASPSRARLHQSVQPVDLYAAHSRPEYSRNSAACADDDDRAATMYDTLQHSFASTSHGSTRRTSATIDDGGPTSLEISEAACIIHNNRDCSLRIGCSVAIVWATSFSESARLIDNSLSARDSRPCTSAAAISCRICCCSSC